MFTKTGSEIVKRLQESKEAERGQELTNDFLNMLNTWHSMREPRDNNIDIYLKQAEILALEKKPVYDGFIYFSPSSANACQRSLYMRLTGAKSDEEGKQAHQGRWQRFGTAIGSVVQRDLLFIAKHGEAPPFKPVFVPIGHNRFDITSVPAWESFVERRMKFEHKGLDIFIKGQPDGILTYKDGKRVGIEIKSKQTSYTRTGSFSMREAGYDHKKQIVAYSLLYGLDEYIILYVNAAKKNWKLDDIDLEKYPDVRAFYIKVTEEDKSELLDYFGEVVKAVKETKPPKLEVEKWTFNNYKKACLDSLTSDEIEEMKEDYELIKNNTKEKDLIQNYKAILEVLE